MGQSGKGLGVRLQQHRDAVRLDKGENALYRHRLEILNVINLNGAQLL